MANHDLYQLQVSHTAGFSSAKEVLDGQIELSRVKAALIGAQVAYNLSQIQLLYEMGQLNETSLSHPLAGMVNAL
jgi:outer membrane protein TolC